MLDCICLGLTLSALLGPMAEETPPEWKPAVSKEGRFTVSMPGKPMPSTKKVDTMNGQIEVHLLVAEGRDDVLFVVSYCDYSAKGLKDGPIEKRLDYARDGAVTSSRGKLRSEKAIKIDGHPGREIVIENKGEIVAKLRIYLVKNRLYQVMVLGPCSNKECGKFLQSFRLNK